MIVAVVLIFFSAAFAVKMMYAPVSGTGTTKVAFQGVRA
jgi:hypothetical protein